jgi:hypothetical protein
LVKTEKAIVDHAFSVSPQSVSRFFHSLQSMLSLLFHSYLSAFLCFSPILNSFPFFSAFSAVQPLPISLFLFFPNPNPFPFFSAFSAAQSLSVSLFLFFPNPDPFPFFSAFSAVSAVNS